MTISSGDVRRFAVFGLCILSSFASVPASAQSTFQTDIETSLATNINDEELNLAQIIVAPAWERKITNSLDFVVSARLRLDAQDDIEPGRPNIDGYSRATQPLLIDDIGTLELRDAYLSYANNTLSLRIGKQQIVWGELEGFKLLDAVNPQSFREFILDDFEQSRIGLWSANAEFVLTPSKWGDWSAQIIWVPDTTVHEIPEAGATFEFRAPRFRFGETFTDTPSLPVRTERRTDTIAASGIGARFVGLVGGWDLSLQAYSGIDPEPLGRIDQTPSGFEFVRFHERRTIIGASAARSFGGVTFRSEVGVQPNRSIVTRTAIGALGETQVDQLSLAFVADFNAPGDIFVSAQVLYDRVFAQSAPIVRPRDDILTSLYIRRDFLNDRLRTTLRWYTSEGGSDGVVRPGITYAFNDSIALEVGLDIFYGNVDGIFGQFDQQDRVSLKLKSTF